MTKSYVIDPKVRVGLADTLVDAEADLLSNDKRRLRVGDFVDIEYFVPNGLVRKGVAEVIQFHDDDEGRLIQIRPQWDGLV